VSVPVAAPLKVIQLASELAVQLQLPEVFVTVTAKLPPPAGADCADAARLYEQAVGVGVVPPFSLQPAAVTINKKLKARASFMVTSYL
jgi:hypothetical protein